jgi:hypothetical protein
MALHFQNIAFQLWISTGFTHGTCTVQVSMRKVLFFVEIRQGAVVTHNGIYTELSTMHFICQLYGWLVGWLVTKLP